MRIYTRTFRTFLIESLQIEANEPPDIKRNELVLRFLFKLKNNLTYTESLVTLDDSENDNFERNKIIHQTNRSALQNFITKIYGGTKGDTVEKNIMTRHNTHHGY